MPRSMLRCRRQISSRLLTPSLLSTSRYGKLKWAEPEWKSSLTASRVRASKAAAGTLRRRKAGSKMPSLSSESMKPKVKAV